MPKAPSPTNNMGFQRTQYSRFSFGRRNQPQDIRMSNNEQVAEFLLETHNNAYRQKINPGEADEMTVTGYKCSKIKTLFCWCTIILSCGLLRLIMHWWPHWLLLATHVPCPLDIAEKLLIIEQFQGKHIVRYVKDVITLDADLIRNTNTKTLHKIHKLIPLDMAEHNDNQSFKLSIHYTGGVFKHLGSLRLFQCKQLRYIWDQQTQNFVELRGLDHNVPTIQLHQLRGISIHEQYIRRLVYGANRIAIPLNSIVTLLFLEVLNPFYIFQIFSVCLWFSYNYYYYAVVIIIMSAFGITMSIIQTRQNQLALYSTVMNTDTANVLHDDGTTALIETVNLVPGDLLEIPSSGCTMQCDAVLLSGNCILDESMLTGESVPVTKTPIPCKRDLIFDIKEHARHMLFCGTKVIQTRYIGSEKVLALVINTGNKTAKGGLIRSILYPPPVDYRFEQDSYKFIMLLGFVAGFGFLYTIGTKIYRQIPAGKIAIESLDLITIAVPPALPAAMTVGRMYAQKRLKQNNIYCISPRSINVSGSIDCVCFDKTGTLTEDGLDMWGVVPKSSTNYFQIPFRQIDRLPYDHLLFGMVTCHSLTVMGGELKGDPLDLKMFESAGWTLEEANVADDTKYDLIFPTIVRPPKPNSLDSDDECATSSNPEKYNNLEIGIVREFSFTSSLQRMSVITRTINDTHFNVYCKGSPEMIITLCKPETIPVDFHSKLDIYAQQGYRIIAIAYKPLDKKMAYAKIQRISRDKIECDLDFQGLVVMENRLKDDTTSVINSLMSANIRTIMVTGDNILTALSVAKDCGMITQGQSIITVNTRPDPLNINKHELYYNLTGQPGPGICINNTGGGIINNQCLQTPTGIGSDYALMTNSNSIASIETIDTLTQTTTATINNRENSHRITVDEDENVELQMATELLCNNYRFAMIGKTWAIIKEQYPELLTKFVTRGTVFARMAPDQKQSLIKELQNVGYYVAMCGDGANDCGALKAAHTGISLSEAESSVASPFTSKNPTIACVPNIIKEGRAALVTLFGIFKYMAAYSLVQFTSVLILYSIDSNLTDLQFLYIDLFLISIFAFFFGKTESYDGPLVKQTPLSSLISLSPIASLIIHLTIAISFQVGGWYHLQGQDWYLPFNFTNDLDANHLGCHENYTIFIISCFQYIILAFVFSKGAPYRKSILSNYGFIISILLTTIFTIYLTISPHKIIIDSFGLVVPPDWKFRIYLIVYGIANFIISLFVEIFLIEYLLFKKLRYRFHNIEKSRRTFLSIENKLRTNTKWPPISSYQTDTQIINDQSSPSSYAEICAEHDIGSPFDQNSSVLNSFFEKGEDNLNENNLNDNNGLLINNDNDERITIVNTNDQIFESRNDSGIDFELMLNPINLITNGHNLNIPINGTPINLKKQQQQQQQQQEQQEKQFNFKKIDYEKDKEFEQLKQLEQQQQQPQQNEEQQHQQQQDHPQIEHNNNNNLNLTELPLNGNNESILELKNMKQS